MTALCWLTFVCLFIGICRMPEGMEFTHVGAPERRASERASRSRAADMEVVVVFLMEVGQTGG